MTIKGTADQLFLQVLWMLLDAVFTPTHFYCHSNIIHNIIKTGKQYSFDYLMHFVNIQLIDKC